MAPIPSSEALLQAPTNQEYPSLGRTRSVYNPLRSYNLAKGEQKHYQQQYADMYFARLAVLKPAAEKAASEAWADFEIGGDQARKVDRVLDVRQGELVWVTGTVYMEMPLKPNILDDISKDHWIAAPPPRVKFTSPDGEDQIMLEDESGRLRLTGSFLSSCLLVTGVIIAVLGSETANGDFEVLDIKVPDLPRQPQRWERDDGQAAVDKKPVKKESRSKAGRIAIVSGLGISGDGGDTLALDLLTEYLLGESTAPEEQADAAQISRLIIAGNSLAHGNPIPSREEAAAIAVANKKAGAARKYGYDSRSYNPAPTERLDQLLATLLPTLPITLIPGETDPTHISLPQQPLHPALFPHARAYMAAPGALDAADTEGADVGWFDAATNPLQADIDGWRVLVTGGQTVDDVFKYIEGEERLEIMEGMLRWRVCAPTAPDTLWCYPFQDIDRFVVNDCPHVYIVGNQPKFETTVIEGPLGQRVRLIAVPRFSETGEIVLVDAETLEVQRVKFEVFGQV